MRAALAALILTTSAAPVAAEVFLSWPVDCALGESCVIEDYVDADPGPGQQDYTCGVKSRDGHSGTDIALLTEAQMQAGVAVLSAAPGRVAAVREGLADRRLTDRRQVAEVECGNGVRIDHGGGLETLYCHLRAGSVAVSPGQRVTRGAVLGQIGMSGLTNFPHLHFTVLDEGRAIDPFAPEAEERCGTDGPSLWQGPPGYDPAGLYTAGFSDAVPDLRAVQDGSARRATLPPDAALVLYGHVFLAQPGDTLLIHARGPQGAVFAHSVLLDAPERQLFRAYGRRAPAMGWPAGDYRGEVRLMRGESVLAVRQAFVTVR
ncbi:M23 family metallopeptidase [Roseivivax sp.]